MIAQASSRRGGELSAVEAPNAQSSTSLILYIASATPNSQRAKANLHLALQQFTQGPGYHIEIVDVLVEAKRALTDSVIVTPTLVAPGPKRRLILVGDLSDPGKLQDFLTTAATVNQR